MNRSLRRHQAGWSLLESVVVVAIVGLMTVGFWQTLALVEGKHRGEHARDTLQRAEDALYGMALRDHHLPMPEDAVESLQWPDHWEGWLPADVLSTGPSRKIRYIVDRSLAQVPPVLYRPDPLGLLADGVETRTGLNGFDLCLQVVQREENTHASGQGTRQAWGVQQVEASDSASGNATGVWLQNTEAKASRSGSLNTRAHSYLEFVSRLGCVPAFAGLATEVKAAVLASDLLELAMLDVSLRTLAVRDAQDSLLNHQWRRVNALARLAVSSWNLVATKLTGATTPLGAFKMGANIVGFTFEAARWAALIEYSTERAAQASEKLEEAESMLSSAMGQVPSKEASRDAHLRRMNGLQAKGLMP